MRWLLGAAVWLLAIVGALVVAAKTKLGPTLVTLSSRHGVHLGDVLAVVLGVGVATAVTVVLWVTAPERSTSSADQETLGSGQLHSK